MSGPDKINDKNIYNKAQFESPKHILGYKLNFVLTQFSQTVFNASDLFHLCSFQLLSKLPFILNILI